MRTFSFKLLFIPILIIGFTFQSCKKDEPEPTHETTTPTPTPEPEPEPQGAPNPSPAQFGKKTEKSDGALIAIKTISTTEAGGQTIETSIGTGVAYFTETSGNFGSFADAGKVELNSKELEIQENMSYVFIPGVLDPTGISFSSGASWTIAGKGGTPAFTASFSDFPATPSITSTAGIKKGTAYTMEFEASAADTVLCGLYSGSVSILKGMKPVNGTNSITFTADDTKDLAVGETGGFLQVALVNFSDTEQGAKKYVLINESVTTKIVAVD